ncbi:acetate/propionate family kinase [Chloroflexota bacterium]
MKILTLNCGSSSVKYAVMEMPSGKKLCHGVVDRVTLGESFIEHIDSINKKTTRQYECPTYSVAIELILSFLTSGDTQVVKNTSEIAAVGHRVVHGGEKFTKPVLVDDEVMEGIEEYCELAPLHNPVNLVGIQTAMKLLPATPNVAIFDTAFLATIPPKVYLYGLPYEWYQKYHVRKYGFHGSSHRYVSTRAGILLGEMGRDARIVTLHIGNGVSITAIKGGIAIDHSMGFTPLEGAIMGTRCGDIDPAIPLYVMKKEGLGPHDMEEILNKKSGLIGISGRYSDRRQIIEAMQTGDERARLAFEIECYRLQKYIGAYATGMGGIDAIVFTGGVGENSFLHRAKVCEGLEFLGIKIDDKKNLLAVGGKQEMDIRSAGSRVGVFVVPTDEELVFAQEVFAVLSKTS